MDKNMINIDDLFRQRLGNGEEEERAGAWLQMRGLLDEKMPAGMVNWRRMFMYTAGLVVLAAISFGGYEISSSTRNTSDASLLASTTNTEKPSAITVNNKDVLAGNNTVDTKQTNNNSSSNTTTSTANTTIKNTSVTNKTNTDNSITSNNDLKTNTTTNSVSTKGQKTVTNTTGHTTQPVDNKATGNNNNDRNNKIVAVTNEPKKKADKPNKTVTNAAAPVVPNATANTDVIAKKVKPVAKHTDNGIARTNSNTKRINNAKLNLVSGSNNTKADAIATKNTQKKIDNTFRVKDSIDRLVVKQYVTFDQSTNTFSYHVDTIAISKMARLVPVTNEPELAMVNNKKLPQNNIPGQSAKANIKDNKKANELDPAAAKSNDAKAGSVADNANTDANNVTNKHNKKGWDWSGFNQALRDFEYNIGKVRVYPGLIAGANKTFGTNPNSGFHVGLTTEFVINDRISAMAELKYMQRFGTGTISNPYTKNDPATQIGSMWLVQTYSHQHNFYYSTYNSLELPIAIRYKTGNFYFYAGGNLVYNFSINANETDLKNPTPESHYYTTANSWPTGTDKINISDLGSRFGIGYLFGSSYEFTPSIMVDARLTQTVWDNAQTDGAKKISNLMYKGPSVQLSIIYRLNHQRPETVTPRY